MRGHIILSHGSDSGPDATKVSALAAQAEALGWRTERPDYRADDAFGHAGSVSRRRERLQAAIHAAPQAPVLVGSSMGSFVSGLVSLRAPVAALFLLATPSAIPGYTESFDCAHVPTWLVHGWNDDVCPPAGVLAFAERRRLPLLLLDDDHRLGASHAVIAASFNAFLAGLV